MKGVIAMTLLAVTAAHADVGPTGTYTTRIEIEVPPYHGLEPHVALAYSSSGGDGVLGAGWQLQAGSTIVRASPGRGTPRFDASDIFLLDGVELVPCQATSTSPSCTNPDAAGGGQYYSTKIETFQRIKFNDATWYIWDREGRKTTLTAQSVAPANVIYRWATSEVRDTHNNHVDYQYTCDGRRECYLDTIRYGHPMWLAVLGGFAEVQLHYQKRPDARTYARGLDLGVMSQRLASISVALGGSTIRAYQVRYGASATTGRSVVTSVQQFGNDAKLCAGPGSCSCTTDPSGTCDAGDVISGSSLPAHRFDAPSLTAPAAPWQAPPVTASTSASPGTPWPVTMPLQSSNWITDNDVIVIPGDINGDGRTDFVYPMVYNDGTGVNALSFSTAISAPDGSLTFVDDYYHIYWPMGPDNDGWNTAQFFAADFNNDHNTDIYVVLRSPGCTGSLVPNANGECPHAVIAVAVSRGDGHYDLVTQDTSLPFEQYTRSTYALTLSAYAGGNTGGGAGAGVSLGLNSSAGGGFDASYGTVGVGGSTPGFTLWYNANVYGPQRWAVADANGDGRADLMVATLRDNGNNTYEIVLRTALVVEGAFDDTLTEQATGLMVNDTNVKKSRLFVGDVNGDGRADWMIVHDHPANQAGDPFTAEHVALEVGLADQNGTRFHINTVDGLGGWSDDAHWLPGDIDGDGRTDFARIDHHTTDSTTTGDHAALAAYLSDGTGLSYRTGPSTDTAIPWTFAKPWCTEAPPETMFYAGDYDGDGRGDIMAVWGAMNACAFSGAEEVYQAFAISSPTGWSVSTRASGISVAVKDLAHPSQQALFAVGDANGDGLPDLLIGKGHASNLSATQTYDTTVMMTPNPAHDTRRALIADITGDGRNDIILPVFMNPGYRIYTQIQQSDGSFFTVSTGTPTNPDIENSGSDMISTAQAWRWMVADVGSPTSVVPDGKADLIYIDTTGGILRIYTLFSAGDGSWVVKVGRPWGGAYPERGSHSWHLMRVNDDGRADLVDVVYDNGLRFDTFLANGDGTWASGSMTISPAPYVMDDTASFRAMDVNGDGRDELVYVRAISHSSTSTTEIRTFFPTDDPNMWLPTLPATPAVFAADVNTWQPMELDGDGAIDLGRLHVDPTSGHLVIDRLLSRGDGTWIPDTPIDLPAPTGIGDVTDTAHYRIADLDGDGLTDLVHIAPLPGGNGGQGTLVLESGRSGWHPSSQTVNLGATETMRYRIADLDADGAPDLLAIDSGVTLLRRDLPADRIATDTNGFGASTAITYRMSTTTHGNGPPGLLQPIVTTTAVTNTMPAVTTVTDSYSFDDAAWSYAERRWIGFQHVERHEGDAAYLGVYSASDGCGLAPIATALRDAKRPAGADLIKQSLFTPIASAIAPYICQIGARRDLQCEGTSTCRVTSQRWEYDEFGNVIRTFVNDLDSDLTDDRMTETPVWPNRTSYIVSLPGYRNTYRCAAWSGSSCSWEHTSSTLFEYDSNVDDAKGSGFAKPPTVGELRRRKPWDNRTYAYPATTYEYDGSGNVTDVTDPDGVITSTGYDWVTCANPYYDVFPCATKTWNPKGPELPRFIIWDLVAGQPNRITDANGQSWSYMYDAFGRLQYATDPGGGLVSMSYPMWGGRGQRVHAEVSDGSPVDGVLWSEQLFDGLGRVYQTRREEIGATAIVRDASFAGTTDALASVSNEYDDPAQRVWTTYQRDVAQRATSVTNPDSTMKTTVYEVGAITTTDERGNELRTAYDTLGRIVDVRERLGTVLVDRHRTIKYAHTQYAYDRPYTYYGDSVDTITDDLGHVSTTTLDARSLTRQACDPDRGCWEYNYRDGGLLDSQIDAKEQTVRFQYDGIGRVTSKAYFDATNTNTRSAVFAWDWDPSTIQPRGASYGHITYAFDSSASAETRFDYDAMGRISEQDQCVAGVCGSTAFTFDVAGRLATIRYPNGEVVTQGYDSAGELASVASYVPDLRHRPDRNPSLMCLGDSTCTSFGYDPNRGWLTSVDVMQVKPPAISSTAYLDRLSYVRDAGGLIKTYTTTAGTATAARTIGYDDLGRLTSFTIAGQPNATRTYVYDSIGDITTSTTQGTYTYDPAHAHAVHTTSSLAFAYDLNGNQTAITDPSGNYRRYTIWDEDNRPSTMWNQTAAGWSTASFAYDAGGARVGRSDATGLTVYFGNYAELDPSGRWTNFYYADGKLIARRDSAGVTYYHVDQVGSPREVTNGSGAVVKSYEWLPYGEQQGSSGTAANDRTFTGALADDDLGLVFMNARYYDPAIAQFVSADSLVPNRYQPQQLNRYSYALGNPISYRDPSGHQAVDSACVENCLVAPPAPRPPAPPSVPPPPPFPAGEPSLPEDWEGYFPTPTPPPLVAATELDITPRDTHIAPTHTEELPPAVQMARQPIAEVALPDVSTALAGRNLRLTDRDWNFVGQQTAMTAQFLNTGGIGNLGLPQDLAGSLMGGAVDNALDRDNPRRRTLFNEGLGVKEFQISVGMIESVFNWVKFNFQKMTGNNDGAINP